VRLRQTIHVRKPVREITLRVRAADVPEEAHIDVTDVQLTPGSAPGGVTITPKEAGTTTSGATQWRNGVVHDGMEIVALADPDRTTPAKMTMLNASGDTKIGSYRFGELDGAQAEVDPRNHRATHGWGRPPLITQRSDLYLRARCQGRAHLRLEWEDREP